MGCDYTEKLEKACAAFQTTEYLEDVYRLLDQSSGFGKNGDFYRIDDGALPGNRYQAIRQRISPADSQGTAAKAGIGKVMETGNFYSQLFTRKK
jgi:hypothetical protein